MYVVHVLCTYANLVILYTFAVKKENFNHHSPDGKTFAYEGRWVGILIAGFKTGRTLGS